jgi:hypothetical protein
MKTVHFVYPHGDSISCPQAIGRKVAERLRERYRVVQYNFDETGVIQPGSNDVLLGHAHPAPWTIFRRSMRQRGWRRILLMMPYHHGDDLQASFIDRFLHKCDLYLAITGNYWFNSVGDSLFAHWAPKMVHLDLAVDRDDFPVVKRQFNPPGRRRFLYIGGSMWQKNPRYLTAIAQRMPEAPISWVGGNSGIPGLVPLGARDFRSPEAQSVVSEFDFMLTVGKADANPATILEAMAWGLIPVCTPQSGYKDFAGIVNVPVDDVDGAVAKLRELQHLESEHFLEMQQLNWQSLDDHFNWDRFTDVVMQAIESDSSPVLGRKTFTRAVRIRKGEVLSPSFMFRSANLKLGVKAMIGRRVYQALKRCGTRDRTS